MIIKQETSIGNDGEGDIDLIHQVMNVNRRGLVNG